MGVMSRIEHTEGCDGIERPWETRNYELNDECKLSHGYDSVHSAATQLI